MQAAGANGRLALALPADHPLSPAGGDGEPGRLPAHQVKKEEALRFLLEWCSTPSQPESGLVLTRNRYWTVVDAVAVSTTTPEMVTVADQLTVWAVSGAVHENNARLDSPGSRLG